jgi:hypothetical protein
MNTNSQQFHLNWADARLVLYVFVMSFLGNVLPALIAFQQTFDWVTLEHALVYSLVGGLITVIVQLVRPN